MNMNIRSKRIITVGVFLMCVGLQLFNYGGSTANGPFLTELGGYHFYSLVNSLGSAGSMIALPAVGAIGNKTGRRNIICIGAAIMLVARCAIQITSNSFVFMALQFVGSFGAGLIMSIPYSLVLQPGSSMIQVWIGSALGGIANSIAQTCLTPFFQHNLPKNETIAAQGMYQFSSTCGSAIFGAVAGVAITVTGGNVKYAFYLAFLMALINILLVLKFVKVPQKCGT